MSAIFEACTQDPPLFFQRIDWSGQVKFSESIWYRYSGYTEDFTRGTLLIETTLAEAEDCAPATGWYEPFGGGGVDYCPECVEGTGDVTIRINVCADESFGCPNTAKAVFSNPYTTPTLKSDTLADLPEDFPNTTAGSYYNLTSDERTFNVREGEYQFKFEIPTTRKRINQCYKLEWIERFTPLTGDPVDTPKSWTWDGEVPEDYDEDDASTYPLTPWFSVAIPTTNGTTLAGYYTDPEDPESYVNGAPTAVCTDCE